MMDEISTGLDSSTTFQIVQSMGTFTHIREVHNAPDLLFLRRARKGLQT